MRHASRAAAWLILIALITLSPIWAVSLTKEKESAIQMSYASWTGVLRLWKCEGWPSGNGSLTAWLNRGIERFEKRHAGVYVQLTDVSKEALSAFSEGGVNPPDMILYAPGMLDAPYSLMEIEQEIPVRSALQGVGWWQNARYAVPVALGGYAMAINSRMLPETPANWGERLMEGNGFLLNAPADGEYRSWSGALIGLFAGSSARQMAGERAPVGDGIDLGLTQTEPEPTRPAGVKEERIQNALPDKLPKDFREQDGVYSQFVSGEIAAMPATQREIHRLQLLDETGKAPDWRMEAIGLPFTDQIALMSVVVWPRKDMIERQSLSVEFVQLLLTREMQEKLTVSRAFPVADIPAIYSGNRGISVVEESLRADDLLLAPAFGDEWRSYSKELMDGIDAGEGTQYAFRMLSDLIGQGE